MTEHPFTQYHLFHLKRKTLEKQITHYYQETRDSSVTIQLLLVMKVRHMLGETDFELFLQDLVKHLFANNKITRALRRYFYFFREYFNDREWKILSYRCFPPEHVTTELLSVVPSTVITPEITTLESS
ncbi:hypothetical protein [Enterococcus pallens]|uniref:Uncharacterized protein n=1 Tax=Enterococcus pallens ATCC BAA-351 TaxID=1158607 RepID=R2QEP8_9ENTE|nr:hypothetical protein [Enterococcus pallens]EOH94942.1 hypothetical protein UAU_01864 [Enterococcus pallens ATCC BAA-351]EOU14739.1 hypothetical protein I588_04389 [Enterococcus pallens ATCC BAA-351]OJG69415.1 hypothetical protein RV10_GL001034 [Enterococcus pallens]